MLTRPLLRLVPPTVPLEAGGLTVSSPHRRPRPPLGEVYLTPSQVAHLFGVTARTVTRWAETGRLECATTLGGHRRFRESDVRQLLEEDRPKAG